MALKLRDIADAFENPSSEGESDYECFDASTQFPVPGILKYKYYK